MEAAALEAYEKFLFQIPSPGPESRFRSDDMRKDLTIMFIEFREHAWSRPVLRNVAHVYGSDDSAQLAVVCGRSNHKYLQDIVLGEGIVDCKFVVLHEIDNVDRMEYNHLLTTSEFWRTIQSNVAAEHVLLVQTDTLTRKRVPRSLLQYDYVGAPWKTPQRGGSPHRCVGNGGYSLRRVQAMIDVCELKRFIFERDLAEDLFFSKHSALVPKAEEASAFAVEHVMHPDPCGMHQIWVHHLWKGWSWFAEWMAVAVGAQKEKEEPKKKAVVERVL